MQLKKIFSIFLVVALIASLCSLTAFADDITDEILKVEVEAQSAASTISDNNSIINQGDEIKVAINITENTGIDQLRLKVKFDTEVFEIKADSIATSTFLGVTPKVEFNQDKGYIFFWLNLAGVGRYSGTDELLSLTLTPIIDTCVDSDITAELFMSEYDCSYFDREGKKTVAVPFVSEKFTANVHTYGEGVVTAPTCSKPGFTTYTCTVDSCGFSATGYHTECPGTPAEAVKENDEPSTCTALGKYDSVVYCSVCGEEQIRDSVDYEKYADHTPDTAVVENYEDSTCDKEGSYDLVIYCAKEECREELDRTTNVVETKPHNWGEATVIEPKYNEEGYSIHTCNDCSYIEKFDFTEALTYILGDVNGDEVIDDADAVHLLYYTLGFDGYTINQVADFNGDYKVDDADAIRLLYHTLFQDYPLIDMEVVK